MEILVLIVFCAMLIACIALDYSLLYALGAGFVLFFSFGLFRKISFREMLRAGVQGVLTVKNILITFLLIGMLTASWRASGTIASVVVLSVKLICPSVFLLLTFLLNSLLSFLTGTAFGTAATMGSVCMTMGLALGMEPVLMGGAILSGVFFGDRCSPVSTSALLVAELTHTDIYDNIRAMLRSAAVPFLISCAVYLACGFLVPAAGQGDMAIRELFSAEFRLGFLPLIPGLVVLLLAVFRVKVKLTLLAGIISAVFLCLFYQKMQLQDALLLLLRGFTACDSAVGAMMNGGGILSMVQVGAIVSISASYSGMFRRTELLESLHSGIARFSEKTRPSAAVVLTSVVAAAVACNQSLAIILTDQLCSSVQKDRSRFALQLENSAVVIAPLIPWSIAGAVPLTTVGAPALSIAAACYLYLLPLCMLITDASARKKNGTV